MRISDIVKKFNGKRLKKSHRLENTQYEFPTSESACQACCAIHASTGRECVAFNNIVTMYT